MDEATDRTRRAGPRLGHVVGFAVSGVMLYLVNHLSEWEWPSFITDDFDRVVGPLTVSIAASMAADILLALVDATKLGHLLGALTSTLTLVATVRLLQVFPFDFAAWDRDWSGVLRALLIVAVVGTAVAVVANIVRFVRLVTLGDGS